MRMVGLSKGGIISMIIIQSFMFVIPSVIFGFIMCFPTLKVIDNYIFTDDMGMEKSQLPSTYAVIQALIIGLVIPLVSAISPIRNALSKNLNDSLDT